MQAMSEFHDLSEVALNAEGKSWGNLGYWSDGDSYSDACRSLATLLGNSSALDSGSTVLDVGFGCGDQLLLWLSEFQVRSVAGVNYSHSQTRWAQQRGKASPYSERLDLLQGDVDNEELWRQWQESKARINRVLALDCLYHFPCRQRFLRRAAGLLTQGGCLGVTDFVLADGLSQRSLAHRALRWMLKQSRIPEHNLVYRDDYAGQLHEAGFERFEIVDISEQVMQGFWQWSRVRRDIPWHRWLKYEVTGRFLGWAYRKQVLRYCLVVAFRE